MAELGKHLRGSVCQEVLCSSTVGDRGALSCGQCSKELTSDEGSCFLSAILVDQLAVGVLSPDQMAVWPERAESLGCEVQ